jgi:hypothetical protein
MAKTFEYLDDSRGYCLCKDWYPWVPKLDDAEVGDILVAGCDCDKPVRVKVVQEPLIKNMYGTEFYPESFCMGLRCGQIKYRNKYAHNSGWYNREGDKLGWGDLDAEDFKRIQASLEDNELFLVLGEGDSFWNFVTQNPGIIGSLCKTEATVEAPGRVYVAKHAMFAITQDKVFRISLNPREENQERCDETGVTFTHIGRHRFYELLGVPEEYDGDPS